MISIPTEFPSYSFKKHYQLIIIGYNRETYIVENLPNGTKMLSGRVFSMLDGVFGQTQRYYSEEIEIDFGMVDSSIMRDYFNRYLTTREFEESLKKMKHNIPEYFI